MTRKDITEEDWWTAYRNTLESADSHRLDVYVRSLAPPAATGRQRRDIEGLKQLVDDDVADDITFSIWGKQICQSATYARTEPARYILDAIERFSEWGDEYDASAAEFFEVRDVDSTFTDEAYSVVVPPQMGLAIHVDGRLLGVFPSRIGGTKYSITDFCEAAIRELTEQMPAVETDTPAP